MFNNDPIMGQVPQVKTSTGKFELRFLKGGTFTTPEGNVQPFRLHAICFIGMNRKARRRQAALLRQHKG